MSSEKRERLKYIGLFFGIGFLIYFLILIQSVLFPFFLGAVIAYVLNPVINLLHYRQGTNRMAAIAVIYATVVFGFLVFAVFVVPNLIEELERLAAEVPELTQSLAENVEDFNERYRSFRLPASIRRIIDETIDRAEDVSIAWVRRATDGVLNLFSHLLSLILAPILSFYMLKDRDQIREQLEELIPAERKEVVREFFREVDHIVGGFIRGQLLISLAVGILTAVGLTLLQIRFAAILGLTAGVLNIIPYFGPVAGAVPAILIASLDSPISALYVLILFVFIQQLESSFLAPYILEDRVGLHPLFIIFSLLAGGKLMGFFGLVFGIPLAGVIRVGIKYAYRGLLAEGDS